MEYHEFGETGFKVSDIGMGTYYDPAYLAVSLVLRHQGARTQKIAALRKGMELGINLIDTAEIYQTEDVVAEAIKGHERENLFIATKVSWNHLRYRSVLNAAENSLKRLKCSYIDLYQVHMPNRRVPVEETMRAMEKLVDEGKVRHIGVSNFSLEQMKKTEEALAKNKLASNQVEYSLKVRKVESDLLSYCEQKHIAILAYRPIAHGLLVKPEGQLKLIMDEISQEYGGKTPAQIALNWLMGKSRMVFPIPRASRPERVIEDAGSVGWSLKAEDMKKLEEAA
jgi:diketogulonate reductase-like aldo/keto reductase